LNLAAVFALTNRPRDAVQEYETVVPMLSNGNMRLDTYETLGRLYSELGQYSKARASFQEVLRMDPQHADAKEGLEKVELSDAIRNVAESPSGEGYFRLGQIFQRAGRAPEAQSAYRQALVLNPKLGEAQKALETLNAQ
jgi:tetratricopeptide (TPR) repeat protein